MDVSWNTPRSPTPKKSWLKINLLPSPHPPEAPSSRGVHIVARGTLSPALRQNFDNISPGLRINGFRGIGAAGGISGMRDKRIFVSARRSFRLSKRADTMPGA
jgi:hypothetical protein